MILSVQDLDPYQWTHGIFTLIFVIISILIGLKILLKYFTTEGETFYEYIPLGLTYIFLSSAYWGPAFNFLAFISTGIPLPNQLFLILNNAFIPLAVICWIFAYTSLQKLSRKKEIRIGYLVISVVWEIIFFVLIFLNVEILYTFESTEAGIYYSKAQLPALIYPIIALLTALITGILFGKESLTSQDRVLRFKGIFLILAFVSFVSVALLGAFLPREIIWLVILRIILILSSFFYYLGLFMPEKIKNIIIR